MLKENYIKRLSFVKYLYQSAMEQSRKSEPFCSFAILHFHDSIELFLQLSLEHLDISKEAKDFIDYWNVLGQKIGNGFPTQKESMKKLNKARVALKHYGILPSKSDIETYRACTTIFFEENTSKIFDVKFSEISLIDLISCAETKESLKKAISLLENKKHEESLRHIAVAFEQLFNEHEKSMTNIFGRSPFFIGEDLTIINSSYLGVNRDKNMRVARSINKTIKTVVSLQKTLKIIAFGIDYKKYTKFKMCTPDAYLMASHEYHSSWHHNYSKIKFEESTVQFCMDFVIESAIVLQSYGINYENGKISV